MGWKWSLSSQIISCLIQGMHLCLLSDLPLNILELKDFHRIQRVAVNIVGQGAEIFNLVSKFSYKFALNNVHQISIQIDYAHHACRRISCHITFAFLQSLKMCRTVSLSSPHCWHEASFVIFLLNLRASVSLPLIASHEKCLYLFESVLCQKHLQSGFNSCCSEAIHLAKSTICRLTFKTPRSSFIP